MPSIRKTKKLLKQLIAENEKYLSLLEQYRPFPSIQDCHLYSAVLYENDRLKQQIQQLKRKKQ